MSTINIGGRLVGDGQPCFVIAELGINHCGDSDTLRKLIEAAAASGAQMVKIQARTPRVCWPAEAWGKPPKWPQSGCKTEGEWKEKLELTDAQMRMLIALCEEHGLLWCASCWDTEAVNRVEKFDPPCFKIASASLTDKALLWYTATYGKPLIVSTGMSTAWEIEEAVRRLSTPDLTGQFALLHCTSTYPTDDSEINLRCIPMLRERYGVPIGYSGHERGIATTVAAVALGATIIERHLTLDRSSWGSDQAASLEPAGFARLVRDIRAVESALGDGVKRVYDSERPIIAKLRRVAV